MTDPYAVRARTHRSDGIAGAPLCKRCHKPYPCAKAGQADPAPNRWLKLAVLVGAVIVGCTLGSWVDGWLFGWWG